MYKNPITDKLVRELYHDELGNPIELSPSQLEIFDTIAGRLHPRVWCGTYTQFGKSFTVGLAVLTRAAHYPEKWTIVAPKTEQAKIIMGYIIDHAFDNELIAKKLELDIKDSAERIRRERSKTKLTFKMADGSIGGVQVLSAQGKSRKNVLDGIMGFGSPNVILDESSLLGDDHFAGVIRMLGGTAMFKNDNFLMQIGNPFYRNHFHKASKNRRYHKILVDWRKGVEEGRVSQDYIDEVKDEMRPEIFRVLYDVKFPEADALDADGYSPLLTQADIDRAYMDEVPVVGRPRMAIDVAAGGRNSTVVCVRWKNAAKIVFRTQNADHMVIGPRIVHYAQKYKLEPDDIGIDSVGVGHGLWNYLEHEIGAGVRQVNGGETQLEVGKELAGLEFENLRALMYWRCAEWLKGGGKLERDRGFDELEDMRYTTELGKKIKLKTKDMMRASGISSPDTADSLAMTFAWAEAPAARHTYKRKPYIARTPYEGSDPAPRSRATITDEDGRETKSTYRGPKNSPRGPYDRYMRG